MPPFQRTLAGVRDALFAELRRIAQYENVTSALDRLDITVDWAGDEAMRVKVWQAKQLLWQRVLRVSKWDIAHMSEETFELRITEAMHANLSIVGQMHHAWLDTHFPRRIKKVSVHYKPRDHTKMVRVEFMNGHVAEGPEHEIKTDLFLARCCMLYDLPPL